MNSDRRWFAWLLQQMLEAWSAVVSWLGEFFLSAGFAGLAAVVAAAIAFRGARRKLESDRDAQLRQQWWDRAEWALNLTLDPSTKTRDIGVRALDALAQSELRRFHDVDFIAAATEYPLNPEFAPPFLSAPAGNTGIPPRVEGH